MENEKEYVLFRVFRDEEDLKFFTDVLDDREIDYRVENPQLANDNIITNTQGAQLAENAMQYNYMLMIAADDMERAQLELRSHIVEYFKNAGYEGKGVEYKPFKSYNK